MARLSRSWVAAAVLAVAWFSGNAGCSSSGGGTGGTSGAGSGGKGGNGGLSGAHGGTAGVSAGGAGAGGGASGGTPAAGGASSNGGGAVAGKSGSVGGTSSGGAAGHQAGSGGAAGTPTQGSGGAAGAGGRPGAAGTPGQTGGNPGTAGTGAAAAGGTTEGAGRTGAGGTSAGGAGGSAPSGTPDALILLDRSGSMNDAIDGSTCPGNAGCGENSKWGLVTSAIEQVLPLYDTSVRWALKVFASANSNSCTVTSGVEVAPALSNGATIATRIAATAAGSSTPTTAAVMAAGTYLATLSDGAPKFIVLVTDGVPTCGTSACDPAFNVANQCDDANAIAAVKSAHDTLGIPTFVVGIGIAPIGGGEATLSAMATNGGYPRAASPVYYPANSTAEITSAFMAIAATIAP